MDSNNKVAAYGDIQITAPYELKDLLQLNIVKRINDHTRIFFTGIIPEENKNNYIEMLDLQKEIKVDQMSDTSIVRNIFKGTVTNVEIKMVRDIYYIEVEGISHTYEMDIELKSRSFQNADMTYSELVKKVIADYEGSDFIDMASKNSKLEKFKIQYNETDWQFLKRMASNFNTGLVVDSTADKPKIWFGIPEGKEEGELNSFNYSIKKKLTDYKNFAQNFMSDIEEKDFIYFNVQTNNYFNIGDKLNFKEKSLFVLKVKAFIEDGTLKYDYTLVSEKGLSQKLILNNELVGVSIEGKVVEVKADNIKVKLDIDKKNSEYCWFLYPTLYAAGGNGGWYCMPETGDSVKLYFPSNKEEEAIIMNSVRKKNKGGDKIDKPNVKYFRAKSGKEAMFNGEEIVLTAKDDKVLIRINEGSGIEVKGDGEINVQAGDLEMSGGTVQINADQQLELICKASYIKMDGSTQIRGSLVKIR